MARCPNCFYPLVFLEKRRKYKCPLCGKLWKQKDIDTREFVEKNKKEKIQSRKQYQIESAHNSQARRIIPKIIEELKNPKPKKTKEEYYKENRDKII